MRHVFATRFAVVVTFALSLCSLASADSPKVLTAPKQTQAEVTQAISPSTDESNPEDEAAISGLGLCKEKNTVCLTPGHMKEVVKYRSRTTLQMRNQARLKLYLQDHPKRSACRIKHK